MSRKLLWPGVRSQIKWHLEDLFDEALRKTWFSSTAKHRFWDSLDYYIFDYLLNGSDLLDADWKAYDAIGISLYNKEEAEVMAEYLVWYDNSFEGEMPDSYYINHPKWPELLERTRTILEMIEANNTKYEFEKEAKLCQKLQDHKNEKQLEIAKEVDKISSFSDAEKEKMKNLMFHSNIDNFDDIVNDILEKIKAAKDIARDS